MGIGFKEIRFVLSILDAQDSFTRLMNWLLRPLRTQALCVHLVTICFIDILM